MDVIFEDNHLLVVQKPQNVPTQADSSGDLDLLSMAKAYVKETKNKKGDAFVGLVHRLDRPTGGSIVFAKTTKSASRLSAQIVKGKFEKKYFAVVYGNPRSKSGRLVNYLKKDEQTNIVSIVPMSEKGAKRAELVYEVLEEKEGISLIGVQILSGRSHQIRVQMANLGHPVWGDSKYGTSKAENLALWAWSLSFFHPVKKSKMTFISLPPEDDQPWKMFNIEKFVNISKN
ncbi:MAG: RluA family pseudouridine synthase [Clostridia bacterium]